MLFHFALNVIPLPDFRLYIYLFRIVITPIMQLLNGGVASFWPPTQKAAIF